LLIIVVLVPTAEPGALFSDFSGFGTRPATLVLATFSLCGALAVESILIGHIPIREDHDTGQEALSLASLLGVSDLEIEVISILKLLVKPALKSIGPFRVILDDGFEVVEELAIGVNTRNFNVGPSMLNEIALKERDRLQLFEAGHEPVE
jgi:hypothetical protein